MQGFRHHNLQAGNTFPFFQLPLFVLGKKLHVTLFLLFQCLGYNAQEMKIGQKTSMDIELLESIEHLEDVVVTGYQTISKERATGSFDIVNKAQIEKPSSNIAS